MSNYHLEPAGSAASAALGLVAAPIMASANTRAGDAGSVYSVSNSAPGLGRAASGEGQNDDDAGAGAFLLGALALVAIGGGIYIALDDNGNRASPGA